MGADTREHLPPRQRRQGRTSLQRRRELRAGFKNTIIFHHPFTDQVSSLLLPALEANHNLVQISARQLLVVLGCGNRPSGDQAALIFCLIYRKRAFTGSGRRHFPG
jgi:hypothetical protein